MCPQKLRWLSIGVLSLIGCSADRRYQELAESQGGHGAEGGAADTAAPSEGGANAGARANGGSATHAANGGSGALFVAGGSNTGGLPSAGGAPSDGGVLSASGAPSVGGAPSVSTMDCDFKVESDTLALWRLSENSQRALDSGPNALHGTLGLSESVNGDEPLWIPQGRFGPGLEFSGAEDPIQHVFVPSGLAFSAGQFTFETFFKLKAGTSKLFTAAPYGLVIAVTIPSSITVILGTGVLAEGTTPWTWQAFSSNATEDTWHYLAVTYDGTHLSAYLDGQRRGMFSVPVALKRTPSQSLIGGVPNDSFPARGVIGPVRISSTPHGSEQIRAVATLSKACPPP